MKPRLKPTQSARLMLMRATKPWRCNTALRPRLREKSQFPPPFLSLGILRQKTHELTHVPFCNWCEACVAGAGRSGQHRRKTDSEDGVLETTVQMDYTFFQRGANQAKVLDESVLVTVLTLVDKTSRWPLSIQVPRKGTEKSQYVLNAIELTIPQHARPQASHSASRPRETALFLRWLRLSESGWVPTE